MEQMKKQSGITVYAFHCTICALRKQALILLKGGNAVKIRKFREAAGLTMTELAGKLGVNVSTVYRWETGEDTPSSPRLPLLADTLGCTIDQLYGRDSPPAAG